MPNSRKAGLWLAGAAAFASLSLPCILANAQEPAPETAQVASTPSAPVIPQQVRFTGLLPNRTGDTVEAVFRIYSAAEGGEPLWTETQRIAVAQDGSYNVLLGAVSAKGLPQTVFGNGHARWVGVAVERGEEEVRIPLASAPYAMKAGDAQTLGGLSPRSFVTQAQLAAAAQSLAVQAAAQITPDVTLTGAGTTNYVPLWTSASNIGNSVIYQTGTKVGINTITPTASLHVVGPTNGAIGMVLQSGAGFGSLRVGGDVNASTETPSVRKVARFSMPDWANDTQGVLLFSGDITSATANDMYFGGATGSPLYGPTTLHFFTSPTSTTVGGTEQMTITSTGNIGMGKTTPAAKLEVNGTAKFDGLITFAAGQTFPGGGGTITGITTTSPLTGSGTSGSVALGLNTAGLETTLNTVYSQLGATTNAFTGGASFAKGITATASGSSATAIAGTGSTGATGVAGASDTGNGGSFSNASAPAATISSNNSGAYNGTYYPVAINATSTGTDSVGAYGEGTLVGVWGQTTASGTYAIYGIAGDGTAAYLTSNGADYATVAAENDAAGSATLTPVVFDASAAGNNAYGMYSVVSGDGADGLYGESDGTTASGSGRSPIGVKGLAGGADGNGLVGDATNTGGYGLYARASGGMDSTRYASAGVYALADSGTGVEGFAVGQSATYNAYQTGFSPSVTAGVWGDSSSNGSNFEVGGIMGTADDNAAGFFVNNSAGSPTVQAYNQATGGASGLFEVFKGSSPAGSCGIGGAGNLTCTGQVKTLATTAGGAHTVETYSMQSPENWMEDFGTGTLEHGVSVVRIDAAFGDTVTNDASYHVFLTPRGDSKGLYVINATATSFEVRESGGGTSSLSFDYRIVAKRRGYEAQRLTDVTERFNAEQASLKRHMPVGIIARASRGVIEPTMAARQSRPAARAINRNARPGTGISKTIPTSHVSNTSVKKPVVTPTR